MQCYAAMITKINKSWLSLSGQKKNLTFMIHQTDSSHFSLELCRAQIWQRRPFREVTSFNCLHCVYKSHICISVTSRNQTNIDISLCMQLQQSLLMKARASTLYFLRHHKAACKHHAWAKPMQGSISDCRKQNWISCAANMCPQAASTPGGRRWVQQPSCLQDGENDLSDSHVSPFRTYMQDSHLTD